MIRCTRGVCASVRPSLAACPLLAKTMDPNPKPLFHSWHCRLSLITPAAACQGCGSSKFMWQTAFAWNLLASQVTSKGSLSHGRLCHVMPGMWQLQDGWACLLGRQALQGLLMLRLQSNCSCSWFTVRCVYMTLCMLLTALLPRNYGVGVLHIGIKWYRPGTHTHMCVCLLCAHPH